MDNSINFSGCLSKSILKCIKAKQNRFSGSECHHCFIVGPFLTWQSVGKKKKKWKCSFPEVFIILLVNWVDSFSRGLRSPGLSNRCIQVSIWIIKLWESCGLAKPVQGIPTESKTEKDHSRFPTAFIFTSATSSKQTFPSTTPDAIVDTEYNATPFILPLCSVFLNH